MSTTTAAWRALSLSYVDTGPGGSFVRVAKWRRNGGGALADSLGHTGGPNRARILEALDDRPRNANRLAEDLDLAYNTVRHHLDVLADNDVVTSTDAEYGTVYFPSDRARVHWETVETILNQLDA